MLEIFILGSLCYYNAQQAQKKGAVPWKWGIYTFLYFLLGEFIGSFFIVSQYHGAMNQQALTTYLQVHKLAQLTVFIFGFGGFLFAKYKIDKLNPN